MAERQRDAFLRELDAELPFPEPRRREIVDEIAAHVDDAIADGVAADVAVRRLGEPAALARDLARPEQSTWRVLAGVGAAVRSGIGHGLYGYLVGTLLVLLGALGVAALVQLAGAWLRTGWTLQTTDGGWTTAMTGVALAFALYHAGRVMPDRLARTSHRLERDVRPWVVTVATVLAAIVTIGAIRVEQNWASVIVFLAAPGAVALGAHRPGLVPAGVRAWAAVAVLALIIPIGVLSFAGSGPAATVSPGVVAGTVDRGLAHIGPWWPGTAATRGAIDRGESGWSHEGGRAHEWRATFVPGSLDGLRDLRLEAWHADPMMMHIDVTRDAPFATAVPLRRGHTLTAEIDTSSRPGVAFWTLVLTGTGADGVRYVVDAGSGGQSTFTGSAWDWLVAVSAD